MTRNTTRTPKPDRRPRTTKTSAERAQQTLDGYERQVSNFTKRRDQIKTQLDAVQADLDEATKRRDYAAQDPALPQEPDPAADDAADPTDPAAAAGDRVPEGYEQ